MAKDPAFLFYPGDFLTGTQFFTDEQVGRYIRLLMAQHQHGHLSEKQMRILCGGITDADIWLKFSVDSSGLYFNQRLEDEVIKRKKHSKKQKANANMRWHKNGITKPMPLEDENENRNENKYEAGNDNANGFEVESDFCVKELINNHAREEKVNSCDWAKDIDPDTLPF